MKNPLHSIKRAVVSKSHRAPLEGGIETLETRIALSGGIGGGFHLKKATFTDADGDRVTVKLVGKGNFDIALDGGVSNRGDIESLQLNNTDALSELRIKVSSRVLPDLGDKVTFPDSRTLGFTEIGDISVTNDLGGLALRGATFNSVDAGGDLGSFSVNLRKSQMFNHETPVGSDPLDKIQLGEITVAGDLGTLTLRGRIDLSNDFSSAVTVGGNLDRVNAAQSDLNGAIVVGGDAGAIFMNDINGSISTGGDLRRLEVGGDFAGSLLVGDSGESPTEVLVEGDVLAGSSMETTLGDLNIGSAGVAGTIGKFDGTATSGGSLRIHASSIGDSAAITGAEEVFVRAGAFAGNIEAGVSVALTSTGGDFSATVTAPEINPGGVLRINGGDFSGILHATTGDVGGVKLTAPGSVFSGTVRSDAGSVGNLSAGSFDGANISAAASVGNIDAEASIEGTTVIAGDLLGHVIARTGHIGGSSTSSEDGSAFGNVFLAGGIGDEGGVAFQARGDISGNTIQTFAGGIGSITAQAGRLAFNTVTSAGGIGAISANSTGGSYAFDANGNRLGDSEGASFSAIDNSVFVAQDETEESGDIESITARASVAGGNAIDASTFSAEAGSIGPVSATANARGFEDFGEKQDGGVETYSGAAIANSLFEARTISGVEATSNHALGGPAIADSTFQANGFFEETALGDVTAKSNGDDAITDSTFSAFVGNISQISGTSAHGHGISDTDILTVFGSIGTVAGTSTVTGDGLNDVDIQAGVLFDGAGSIDQIIGLAKNGDGIDETSVKSGTGGIGTISGLSGGSYGDGIDDSSFFTQGSIGEIEGIASSGHGITDSEFSADGDIGDEDGISAATSSDSIDDSAIRSSVFRAGGNISGIEASTFIASANAISGSVNVTTEELVIDEDCPAVSIPTISDDDATIFSAFGNIGDVNVSRGNIDGAIFLAGYDIGGDMSFDGLGGGDDFANDEVSSIGDFNLDNGNIKNTAIAAGVFTDDATLGNADDALNAPGSSVGAINAFNNGFIENLVLESDFLGTLNVGHIESLNLVAYTGDFGGFNIIGSFPGDSALGNVGVRVGGDVGDIYVENTALFGGSAIQDVIISAGGSIGNVTAITNGGATGEADGIADSCFIAEENIGDINVTVASVDGDDGIDGVDFEAGGNIGNVKVTSVGAGDGIVDSDFIAGGGIGSIDIDPVGDDGIDSSYFSAEGNIGDITVAILEPLPESRVGDIDGFITTPGASDDGIIFSEFYAGGNIGNVYAYTSGAAEDNDLVEDGNSEWQEFEEIPNGSDGIAYSTFSAVGSIGNVTGITDGTDSDDDGLDHVEVYAGGGRAFFRADKAPTAFTGGNIGDVSGISAGGNGIKESSFVAYGNIGAIAAEAPDFGIIQSSFYATENIGAISVTAEYTGIMETIFSADGYNNGKIEDGSGSIASIYVETTGTGGEAIASSSFFASSGIGAENPLEGEGIVVVVGDEGYRGITDARFFADIDENDAGAIGNIRVTSTGTGDGIELSNFVASSIGNITVSQPGADGIDDSDFLATNGGIGNVSVTAKDNAISSSTFRSSSGGDIGDISATSLDLDASLLNSIFTTTGSIGNIVANGQISGSKILAGVDTGTDFALNGNDSFATSRSVGTITVNGVITGSDIIASVQHGNGVYGDNDDFYLSGGSIGVISITNGGSLIADQVSGYGIEAEDIADITLGGNVNISFNGSDFDIPVVIDAASDVRIRGQVEV